MKKDWLPDLLAIQGSPLPKRFREVIYKGWGIFIENPARKKSKNHKQLQVVLFISYPVGYQILKKSLKLHKAGKITITGVATDDVIDPHAKISKKKRVWQYFSDAEQKQLMLDICNLSLENGIPIFSGQVKSDLFYQHILPEWRPDAIIVGGFGQILDRIIWGNPLYGTYNLHPSNLLEGEGKGADPFKEVILHKRDRVFVSLHHIDDTLDSGHIVGVDEGTLIIKTNPNERMSIPEILVAIGKSMANMTTQLLLALTRLKQTRAPAELILYLDFNEKKII